MNIMWKYAGFARIAATQAARHRSELYARMGFVAVILGVFSALWRAAEEAGLPVGVDRFGLIWYLAATEWIVLSAPLLHVDMESEIRRGDVAYPLTRPFSYPAAVAAQGLGMLAVRAPGVGIAALVCGYTVTGGLPDADAFAYVIPFGLIAMVLLLGLYLVIGLTAFWLGDVSPLFWLSQKLIFVLGGLMLPLSFYPGWLQRAAYATPFPSLLSGPAGLMIDGGDHEVWWIARDLAVWGLVIVLVAHLLFQRAARRIQLNGG